MSNIFSLNSYHILGLDTSAGQKDISKRHKEILQRLKIDDVPQYDLDLDCFNNFRTETALKEAVQKLSVPKKRIKEHFFWFDTRDAIDEQALGSIRAKDYLDAIRIWRTEADKNNGSSLFYKRNLAVLYCLAIFVEKNRVYLNPSLKLWGELSASEKFWESYFKAYKLSDELGADQEVIEEFRRDFVSYLSDVYTEISEYLNDRACFLEFQKLFAVTGKKAEKITDPIYTRINTAVEELESMDISADGVLDAQETKQLKKLVKDIQDELNQLVDLGLYEDSKSKSVRDRAATSLRKIVMDLHNDLDEKEKSKTLLLIALKIAGTDGLKNKLTSDLADIQKFIDDELVSKPILQMIEEKKFAEAFDKINQIEKKYKDNKDLQEFFREQKKLAVTMLALTRSREAHKLFDAQKEDEAKPIFEEVGLLIRNNIHLFDFNEDALNKALDDIQERTSKATIRNLGEFDKLRNEFIDIAKNKFEDKFESNVLICVVDAHIYAGIADMLKRVRERSKVAKILNVIGWVTVWFYGIGILFWIGSWIYNNQDN